MKDLQLPVAAGKVKRLRASEARALEGASCCLRLSQGDFEDACRVQTAILEPLVRSVKAAAVTPEAPATLSLQESLMGCSSILRLHDAKQVMALWAWHGSLKLLMNQPGWISQLETVPTFLPFRVY